MTTSAAATPIPKDKENDAALEFMRVIDPLLKKAAELGIVDPDTTEYTDAFQSIINSFPNDIQFHAAAVLVIDEWLRRTNQSIPDDLKMGLTFLALNAILDGSLKFVTEQYESLIEELKSKGLIEEREDDKDKE